MLFINHTSQLGGAEIALRNLVQRLDRRRVDPVVLLFSPGTLADELGTQCEVVVMPVADEVINTRKDSLSWNAATRVGVIWRMIAFTWRLSRTIRNLNVQIVHTNSLKAHVLGGVAARLAGTRLIWHVRDRIADDYLPVAAVRIMKALSRVVPHFIVANSRATLNTLISDTDVAPDSKNRFSVVHDGCDVPPSVRHLVNNSPQIGLVGRISPWKGQDVFIKAAAIVRRSFHDARFFIVGAPLFSEGEYENHLKALTHNLELDDSVEFLGFVRDVPGVLSKLDAVVHASTIGEPFGQVVIEAMAAEKPVIATNGGGIPEIVVDHVTGLLVPMGDEVAMANSIVALLSDPQLATDMGRRGRQRVIDHFTLSRVARDVEQVYADAVGRELTPLPMAHPATPEVRVQQDTQVAS